MTVPRSGGTEVGLCIRNMFFKNLTLYDLFMEYHLISFLHTSVTHFLRVVRSSVFTKNISMFLEVNICTSILGQSCDLGKG